MIGGIKIRKLLDAAASVVLILLMTEFSISTANAETAALITQSNSMTRGDLIADYIAEASQRFGIPAAWIRAVISVESAGNVHAVSPAGAMGLMQIMPQTWSDLHAQFRLGNDPFNPRDNILAGAAYLREMHDRYGTAGFLAAYNAGPERYEEHVTTGQPLPPETQRYIEMLMPIIARQQTVGMKIAKPVPISWMQAPLFVPLSGRTSSATKSAADAQTSRAPFGHSGADLVPLIPRSNHLFVPIFGREPPR